MSLAISVIQTDFIISTSDSAITLFVDEVTIPHLAKMGIDAKMGEMITTDGKSEKVHKISNKVFLSSCGNSILTDVLLIELLARVNENDDLSKCRQIAQVMIKDVMDGKIYNQDKILIVLKEKLQIPDDVFSLVKDNFQEIMMNTLPKGDEITELVRDFSAYLIGFTDDGSSGIVDVRSNKYMECPKDKNKGYPILIDGHHPDYSENPRYFSEYQRDLILPIEHRTLENFIKEITYVHAKISKLSPINVSTDCTINILSRNGKEIEYNRFLIETSEFHERL